jgi:uncharacterized membrane protein
VLTLWREALSSYDQFSGQNVAAAQFVLENTDPKALFLTADNHTNAVASLTGRNILCGSGSYLYFHGVDYSSNQSLAYELFQNPTREKLAESHIDYVYIGDAERWQFESMDFDFFAANYPEIYSNGDITIFKISE